MTEESAAIETGGKSSSIRAELKDADQNEQVIDSLIESQVVVSKPVPSSLSLIQRFAGILYALLSAFLFTISIFVTKQLQVDLIEALIPRFLLQSILMFIYMTFIRHYPFYGQSSKPELILLMTNLFCALTGFFAFFIAYRYLSLPDVTTIRYTQVIWIAIISAILYREKPSVPTVMATVLTMVGVTCVAQPSFLFEKESNLTSSATSKTEYQQRSIGLLIAFYSSIAMSVLVITNKQIISKYKNKNSLIIFQYAFASLCLVLTYCCYKYYFLADPMHSIREAFLTWRYLWASSACLLQIVISVLIQKAMKREHPSIFTIVQSSDILFSILLQNIFSSAKSNILSIFGSILVLMSIVIVAGSKLINERKRKKTIAQT